MKPVALLWARLTYVRLDANPLREHYLSDVIDLAEIDEQSRFDARWALLH